MSFAELMEKRLQDGQQGEAAASTPAPQTNDVWAGLDPEAPKQTTQVNEDSLYTDQQWIAASRRVAESVRNSNDFLTDVPDAKADDAAYAEWGIQYMGQFNHNLMNMGVDALNVKSWEPEDAQAFGHLLTTYSNLPNWTWSGTGRLIKGMLSDPTTYVGVGLLGRIFGVQTAGKEAVQYLVKQGIKQKTAEFMVKGAAVTATGATEGAIYTGAADALTQSAEISADLRDEFDLTQTLQSAGYGAGFGALVPSVGFAALQTGRAARDAVRKVFPKKVETPRVDPTLARAETDPKLTGSQVDEVIADPQKVIEAKAAEAVGPDDVKFRETLGETRGAANDTVVPESVKPGNETITRRVDDIETTEPAPANVKNLSSLETTDDVRLVIHSRALAIEERLVKADLYKGGTQTLESAEQAAKNAVKKIAADLGENEKSVEGLYNKLTEKAKGDIPALRQIQARALAISETMTEVADRLTKMAKSKSMADFTNAEKAEFLQLRDTLDSLALMDGLYSRQFARNLGSRRITRGTWNILDKLESANKTATFTDEQAEFAKLYEAVNQSNGNLASLREKTKPGFLSKLMTRLNGFRTEAMISGASTQQMAAFGNILNLAFSPLLKKLAAKKIPDVEKAARMQVEAAIQLQAYKMYFRESWQAARAAFRIGDSLTDPSGSRLERVEMGLGAETPPGFIQKLYKFKLFGDLMNGYDEMAKFLYTRSTAYARAYIKLSEEMPHLSPDELSKQADLYVKTLVDVDTGAFKDKNIVKEAREITFTNDINDEILGQVINRLANASGGLGRFFVFPFVKAPLNMISMGMKMTPGTAYLSPRQRTILSNHEAAKAQLEAFNRGDLPDMEKATVQAAFDKAEFELAKLKALKQVGYYFAATSITATASGHMTGNGPSDPNERRDWLKAGNKPMSIKAPGTNTWISYKALEPFATPMAIFADLTYFFTNRAGRFEKPAVDEALALLNTARAAVTDNILNKSTLMGVEQLLAALNDEKKGEQYLKSLVTSFMPNALRDAGNLMDDEIKRENGTLANQLSAKLPFLMESVGHKYDMFGRPLDNNTNPLYGFPAFAVSQEPDPVLVAISELKAKYDREGALGEMPYNLRVNTQDIDFRAIFNDPNASSGESVYSQYHRILGGVTIQGKTMYQAVREYVGSNNFAKMSYGNKGFQPIAIQQLNEIIGVYRDVALGKLHEQSAGYRREIDRNIELEKAGFFKLRGR